MHNSQYAAKFLKCVFLKYFGTFMQESANSNIAGMEKAHTTEIVRCNLQIDVISAGILVHQAFVTIRLLITRTHRVVIPRASFGAAASYFIDVVVNTNFWMLTTQLNTSSCHR